MSSDLRSLIEQTKTTIDLRVRSADQDLVGPLISRMFALSHVQITPIEPLEQKVFGDLWIERDFTALANIIQGVSTLRSLIVSNNINSYAGVWSLNLSSLSGLECLVLPDGGWLGRGGLPDFQAVTKLKKLSLMQNWHGVSQDLSCLTRLTSLALLQHWGSASMDCLVSLTSLRSFTLNNHYKLQCISALSSLTLLTHLSLDKCSSLRSMDILTSLSNLQRLSCVSTGERCATVFTSLTQLRLLDLSRSGHLLSGHVSRSTPPDLESLGCLSSLTKLWLDDIYFSPIQPLTALAALRNLQFLSLCDMYFRDDSATVMALRAAMPRLHINVGPDKIVHPKPSRHTPSDMQHEPGYD